MKAKHNTLYNKCSTHFELPRWFDVLSVREYLVCGLFHIVHCSRNSLSKDLSHPTGCLNTSISFAGMPVATRNINSYSMYSIRLKFDIRVGYEFIFCL